MIPKVSVIIPIYGVEKYIERCARSLFSQTLIDIEYIFVNDCTKDNSMRILNSVIADFPNRNVKILEHEINKGLPTARKTGIAEAQGEYIAHCDSDDWVCFNMYSEMYEYAKSNDYDIVYCDYLVSDGNQDRPIKLPKQPSLLQGPVWNKLVKHSLYTKDIIYPIENKAEDGALMTQLSYFANSVGYLQKPLYYYFHNPESICRQISESACLEKLRQECANTDLKIAFLRKQNAIKMYKNEIIQWKYISRLNIIHLLKKKQYYDIWKSVYPEINKEYLFCKEVGLRKRFIFLQYLLRIKY